MAQTTVSIRMDNDLKNSFDHICNELGMSCPPPLLCWLKR